MISRSDVESLIEREPKPGSPVLSVYLNIIPSRLDPVNRAFEVVLKNLLREIESELDKKAREEFQEDTEPVFTFLEDYREPKRGLVIFCDQSESFFWFRELRVGVTDGVWWRDTPYVRPLIEIMDEHERYGMVLTDREHSRLFTVFVGEIEEHHDAFAKLEVQHIKTTGTDHLRSQMNIERKGDEHAHLHLKKVAELMSKLALLHEFDRLILGGTVEASSELAGLLPKALRGRLVRTISLPVDASEQQVLDETLKVEESIERARENELVNSLVTAAAKHQKAVLGLDETLLALQEWRVWQLVYADGFTSQGGKCTNCGALLTYQNQPCSYCGGPVREISDLVAWTAQQVFEMPGKVEQVRGNAATQLKQVGSIGAFLRY
jgi:peptide subunit release factor 1 (eRF1)